MFKWIKGLIHKRKYANSFEDEEVQQLARDRAEEIRRLNYEEREAQHKLKVLRAKNRIELFASVSLTQFFSLFLS